MPYSGALDTALQADGVLLFYALEIILPGPVNVRLLDGPGSVVIGGNTFTGLDATYGALGIIQSFADGVDTVSPHLIVQMAPPTNAAAATLAGATAQGSVTTLYFGVLNTATGALVGSIDTLFVGEIDFGRLTAGRNSRWVELDISSVWDRFFDVDEGFALNNAWQKSVYSAELGLEYVTDIQLQIPWGTDGVRPNVVADIPLNVRALLNNSYGGVFGAALRGLGNEMAAAL